MCFWQLLPCPFNETGRLGLQPTTSSPVETRHPRSWYYTTLFACTEYFIADEHRPCAYIDRQLRHVLGLFAGCQPTGVLPIDSIARPQAIDVLVACCCPIPIQKAARKGI